MEMIAAAVRSLGLSTASTMSASHGSEGAVGDLASPSAAPFNPVVALQSVLAGEMVSIKQRAKAAQQLAVYFEEMPTTPGVYALYEPYLPVLTTIVMTPIKATKEVQDNTARMIKALGAHCPHRFVEWCGMHASSDAASISAWCVDWCCGLVLTAETRVPRRQREGSSGSQAYADTSGAWDERSVEYIELDAGLTAIFQQWRSLLDIADDENAVSVIVQGMSVLLCHRPTGEESSWVTLVTSKIQPHFVDIADVLIGWTTNESTSNTLRNDSISILHEMHALWAGNSVFSLQLLQSFANDILALYSSSTSSAEDRGKTSSILTCCMMVARCVPALALANTVGRTGPAVKVLSVIATPGHFVYSAFCIVKCVEYFISLALADLESFAPHSVRAVRFLVVQVASLLRIRTIDSSEALFVLEQAAQLAKRCFPAASSLLVVSTDVVEFLSDELVTCVPNNRFKSFGVVQGLLQFTGVGAAQYLTEIFVELLVLSKMDGLGVAVENVSRAVETSRMNCALFWVACCVIACKNSRLMLGGTVSSTQEYKSTSICIALRALTAACASRVSLFAMIAKLIEAIVTAIRVFCGPGKRKFIDDTSLDALSASLKLMDEASNIKQLGELLDIVRWILPLADSQVIVTSDLFDVLIDRLQVAFRVDNVTIRSKCIHVLIPLARLPVNTANHATIAAMAMQCVNESEPELATLVILNVLPFLEPALFRQQHKGGASDGSEPQLCVIDFGATEFERVFALLEDQTCSEEKWYRECVRIQVLMKPSLKGDPNRLKTVKDTVQLAAKWIVQNRLRSHLGSPSGTFSSIEGILRSYVDSAIVKPFHVNAHVSPLMLIEFVSTMESSFAEMADIHYSSFDPESEAFKVGAFYRANAPVCEEWLGRTRPLLVTLSRRMCQTEGLRHHSMALVTLRARNLEYLVDRCDPSKSPDELQRRIGKAAMSFEQSVFELCESFCELRDADSIIGFRVWCASWCDRVNQRMQSLPQNGEGSTWNHGKFSWVRAMQLETQNRYEEAVFAYETVIEPALQSKYKVDESFISNFSGKVSDIVLVGCIKHCGQCYAFTRQWLKFLALQARLKNFVTRMVSAGYKSRVSEFITLSETWDTEYAMVSEVAKGEMVNPQQHTVTQQEMEDAAKSLEHWGDVQGLNRWSVKMSNIGDAVSEMAHWLQVLRHRESCSMASPLHSISKLQEEVIARLSMFKHISIASDSSSNFYHSHGTRNDDWDDRDATVWCTPYFSSDLPCSGKIVSSDYFQRDTCVSIDRLIRLARWQHNIEFAKMLFEESEERHGSQGTDYWRVYEKCVLQLETGKFDDGILALGDLCSQILKEPNALIEQPVCRDFSAHALLRLARTVSSVKSGDEFVAIENLIDLMDPNEALAVEGGMHRRRDDLVRRCLSSATAIHPASPRVWLEYSKWCHRQGRIVVDDIANHHGCLELLSTEEESLDILLNQLDEFNVFDRAELKKKFRRVMDNDVFITDREHLFQEFLLVHFTSKNALELTHKIIELQRQCVSRVFEPLKMAAQGYGSFLSTATLHHPSQKTALGSQVTAAALRLLRLLTTYAAVRDIADEAGKSFTGGPLAPWGRIVPQLLARLGHSSEDVSKPVSALLRRLGRNWPHLVVYSAIVESERSRRVHSARQIGSEFHTLLHTVVEELRRESEELVKEVEIVVSELNRISFLWDDTWIAGMAKISSDVTRRIATLDKEAERVAKNDTISIDDKAQLAHRKSVAIMKPVLVAIEQLWTDTAGGVQSDCVATPHERYFLNNYGTRLASSIQALRDYCEGTISKDGATNGFRETSMPLPTDIWLPFGEVLKELLSSVGRRERLNLSEISPALADISRRRAAAIMPGVVHNESDLTSVTIREVSRSVTVLRTKTKPKRLTFGGSDGQTYQYLLKSREDLRLDERMMQFHGTVNELLCADHATATRELRMRNYSVVPLSTDAGLIQMVPDVMPLFQVYTSRASANNGSSASTTVVSGREIDGAPPQAPTAQFYSKLKQYGVSDVSPVHRAQWPRALLRRVYNELVAARPSNVLHRELLVRSADSVDCWNKETRLSRSIAVASVLGYVIGLGDRHLDNILLCTHTGEVVHIDYNVCFDKGRKLKVPELVPFRLTPMLVDGLGITGVEGKFRVAFEETLRVIRDSDAREALLALLEAFVYDPLVDWVANGKTQNDPDTLKKRLDVNVNLSLFLSRTEERRHSTSVYQTAFDAAASSLTDTLVSAAQSLGTTLCRYQELDAAKSEVRIHLQAWKKLESDIAHVYAIEPTRAKDMYTRLDALISRLGLFESDCRSRYEQSLQHHHTLMGFRLPDVGGITTAVIGTSFSQIHSTLWSAVSSQPTSMSISVWQSLLAALQGKCASLDTELRDIVSIFANVSRELIPCFQASQAHQLGVTQMADLGITGSIDELSSWVVASAESHKLVQNGEFERASASLSNALMKLSPPLKSIVANERGLQVREMHRKFDRIKQLELEKLDLKKVELLGQQAFSMPAVMKMSNSQTQRALKLAACYWVIPFVRRCGIFSQMSTISEMDDDLHVDPVQAVLHCGLQTLLLVLDIVDTPKGSLKKIQVDSLLRRPNRTDSQRGRSRFSSALEVLIGLMRTVHTLSNAVYEELVIKSFVYDTVGVLSTDLIAQIRQSVPPQGDTLLQNEPVLSANSCINRIMNCITHVLSDLDALKVACDDVGAEINIGASRVTWLDLLPTLLEVTIEERKNANDRHLDDVASSLQARVCECTARTVHAVLPAIVRGVVTEDWKIDVNIATFDEPGSSWEQAVEQQVLQTFPSLSNTDEKPLHNFRQWTASLVNFLSACEGWWHSEYTAEVASDRATHLTDHLQQEQCHQNHLEWIGQCPERPDWYNRRRIVETINQHSPSMNSCLHRTSMAETALLEIAQQLEYVLSQVTFSLGENVRVGGEGLQHISEKIQASYTRCSLVFELVRKVASMCEAVSSIEVSSRRDLDYVKQVGPDLLAEIANVQLGLSEIGSSVYYGGLSALSHQLETTIRHAQSTQDTVNKLQTELSQACAETSVVIEDTMREIGNRAAVLHDVLVSFEQPALSTMQASMPNREKTPSTTKKEVDSGDSERLHSFSFSDNRRLMKILLRNVKDVPLLHGLAEVLLKYESTSSALERSMRHIGEGVTNFMKTDVHASGGSHLVRCIGAMDSLISNLRDPDSAVESGPSTDSLTLARSRVAECNQLFFDAADRADKLLNSSPGGDAGENTDEAFVNNNDRAASPDHSSPNEDRKSIDGQSAAAFASNRSETKNLFGLGVVKCIEAKLAGVMTESTVTDALSVEDQASSVISEATNVDNLCVMYEGWTPWI